MRWQFPATMRGVHHLSMFLALGNMFSRPNGWQQIHHEREDVTREDKGDDPLEDSADIPFRFIAALGADAEADG